MSLYPSFKKPIKELELYEFFLFISFFFLFLEIVAFGPLPQAGTSVCHLHFSQTYFLDSDISFQISEMFTLLQSYQLVGKHTRRHFS